MVTSRIALAIILIVALGGCGDSGTGVDASFEPIGGSYSGSLAGNSQGVVLDASFSMTIGQNQGDLSGSYALTGTLSDGSQVVDVQGTGSIDGTIDPGADPSVDINVTPGFCPNQIASFSGSYDSTNERLIISGPVEFFDSSCEVVLVYSSIIVLQR